MVLSERGGVDWERVYREHAPRLRRLIARRVPRASVDDVLQDTFVRAYRSRHRLDTTRPLWPFLATLAQRSSIQWHRSHPGVAQRAAEPVEGPPLADFPGSDEHLAGYVEPRRVMEVLAGLTPRHRRILFLHGVEDRGCDAIAEADQLREQAVRSLLDRARANFRATYGTRADQPLVAVGLGRHWWLRLRHRLESVPLGAYDCLGLLAAGTAVSAMAVLLNSMPEAARTICGMATAVAKPTPVESPSTQLHMSGPPPPQASRVLMTSPRATDGQDLAPRTASIIRACRRPHSNCAQVEGSWNTPQESTVVYSQLASVPDLATPEPSAEWTINAFDLKTHKRRELARSSGKGAADTNYHVLPRPVVEGRWVVWVGVPGGPDDGGDLVVHDLRTGTQKVVARGTFPGKVSLWDGLVVYDNVSAQGRDLFVVPADGSAAPRQVTEVGTVSYPRFANGWAAWQEVVEEIRNAPEGYRMDLDPVWVVPVTGGRDPVRFERGMRPVPGATGFVVTSVADKGLVVYDVLDPSSPPLVIAPVGDPLVSGSSDSSAAEWAVDGSTVAWTTMDGGLRLTRLERG